MEFNFVLIILDPGQDWWRLVPLCVVRDEVYSASLVLTNELVEEFQVCHRIEDPHKSEMELRAHVQRNSANHLDACSAGKALHLRSDASACPVAIQRTRLSEQRLVFIQQHAVLSLGFFLLPAAPA